LNEGAAQVTTKNKRKRATKNDFGAIRKLPSGKYQASFISLTGARELAPQTFATRGQASLFLSHKRAELDRHEKAQRSGKWQLDPERGAITLAEYLPVYFQAHPEWSATTRDTNTHSAKRILTPLGGVDLAALRLDSIKPEMVSAWWAGVVADCERSALTKPGKPLPPHAAARRWARRAGISCAAAGKVTDSILRQWEAAGSPQSSRVRRSEKYAAPGRTQAARTYALLKAIFNQAIQHEIIERNPCKDKSAGRVRSAEMRSATPEQVETLANAVPERYRAAVWLAAYSGLRQGELFGLARKHYDPQAHTLRVERSLKRSAGNHYLLGQPKTQSSHRTVTLPRTVAKVLDQHLAAFGDSDPESFLFTTSSGLPVSRGKLHNWWDHARKQVGLDFTWHELRHTGQTFAASVGTSPRGLMARMGHRSMRASMIYLHAIPGEDQKIAERLDQQIEGAQIIDLAKYQTTAAG
jgi:integrase